MGLTVNNKTTKKKRTKHTTSLILLLLLRMIISLTTKLISPVRAFRFLPINCSIFWKSRAAPAITTTAEAEAATSVPYPQSTFVTQSKRTSTTRLYTTSTATQQSYNQSSFAMVDDAIEEEEPIIVESFPDEILQTDTYNGVSIRLDHVKGGEDATICHPESFRQMLKSSLQTWKDDGRKGIWIYAPTERSNLVPIATSLGFKFHMVNAEGMLILSRWLPTDTPSRLPRGPMYQVGVGCIVLKPDDATQMLVVQELTGPAAAAKLWKMPTGLADPAEDIHEAAERELFEETGLRATCDGILVFRQSHASRAGTRAASDLFFVCRMRIQDDGKNATLTAQPEEIADIQWMPIQDFLNQELWQQSPLYAELNNVCLRANERDVFAPRKLPVGLKNTPPGATNTLYKSCL